MAGGFYMTQEAPDHAQYYKLGEEIVTWSNSDDFIDKLNFYLHNPQAASKIRDAGQRRVLEEHTWRHRFDRLLDQLRSLGKNL
jgi:spore maturation protein CgeB